MSHLLVLENHMEKVNITRFHSAISVYFLTIYMTHPVYVVKSCKKCDILAQSQNLPWCNR